MKIHGGVFLLIVSVTGGLCFTAGNQLAHSVVALEVEPPFVAKTITDLGTTTRAKSRLSGSPASEPMLLAHDGTVCELSDLQSYHRYTIGETVLCRWVKVEFE